MKKMSDPFGLGALERFATSFRADYRFGPLNILVLLAICLAGLAIHVTVYPFDIEVVITVQSGHILLVTSVRAGYNFVNLLHELPGPHIQRLS